MAVDHLSSCSKLFSQDLGWMLQGTGILEWNTIFVRAFCCRRDLDCSGFLLINSLSTCKLYRSSSMCTSYILLNSLWGVQKRVKLISGVRLGSMC